MYFEKVQQIADNYINHLYNYHEMGIKDLQGRKGLIYLTEEINNIKYENDAEWILMK